jgi:hypothetical protein
MKYLFYLFVLIGLMGASSCNDPITVDSLCIIDLPVEGPVDLDTKICWISKEEKIGFTLRELNNRYSIDEVDLRKITDRLNECQKAENSPTSLHTIPR